MRAVSKFGLDLNGFKGVLRSSETCGSEGRMTAQCKKKKVSKECFQRVASERFTQTASRERSPAMGSK
eukprot:6303341-Amphidinium_carterae.1